MKIVNSFILMVTVLFKTQSHYPASRKKIAKAIEISLTGRVKRDCEVSVSIVGDRQMHKLNKQYRAIDDTTDVLSFPLNDSTVTSGTPFVEPPDGILRLGDIVLSYPQAVAEAADESMMVDDKINFLILHGLDHLLGIHHPE